jgi:hypothetical protein
LINYIIFTAPFSRQDPEQASLYKVPDLTSFLDVSPYASVIFKISRTLTKSYWRPNTPAGAKPCASRLLLVENQVAPNHRNSLQKTWLAPSGGPQGSSGSLRFERTFGRVTGRHLKFFLS